MKTMKKVLFFLVFFLLISCSPILYVSDHLNSFDPLQYTTYGMEENCGDEINPIMAIRIKNALEKNLRQNGYENHENPDLLVKYFIKNITKKYVEECTNEYDRWHGGETCKARVISYEEGSIVIDIIDTNNNTIIWHGAVRGPSFENIKNPNSRINEMIDELLEYYFSINKSDLVIE